ncbi:mevalonate kinase [Streptomyces cellulosae]
MILLGEHAVVYGAPAVALAVPGAACRAEARLRTQPGPGLVSFRLHSDDGPQPLAEGAAAPALHTLVDSVLRRAGGQQARGVELTVFSGIPPGCGMGSSAACARACAVALARLLGLRLRPQDVFELVQEAEQVSHGRASGIDAHATGSPGLLVLRDGVPSIVEAGRQAWLVVADSGTASSTRQAVEMLGAAFTRNPVRRRSFLARSRRLTADGLDALTSGRPRQLGRALTGTHTLLMEQGLVNGPVRSLVDVALAAGALGAKMTGGGLGGCALALAGTPAQADLLAHRLRGHGARRTWTVPLVQGGG